MKLNIFNKARKATLADWEKVQGGKPTVTTENGATKVVHNYEGGEGMVVPTMSKQLKETVTLDLDGQSVEFPVALLRRFHGEPCETRSRRQGGKGYERE